MNHKLVCLLLCFSILSIDSYKILMICPSPIKSHHTLCKAVMDTLFDRGHQLTFINAFPSNKTKYREIGINMDPVKKSFPMGFDRANMSFTKSMDMLRQWGPSLMVSIFNNDHVQTLINDESEKFDLFILEYYMSEILLGFSVRFDCPAIILSSIPLMTWLAALSGNPLSIATIPHYIMPYTQNMNLPQRIVNLMQHVIQHFVGIIVLDKPSERLYNEYFFNESKLVSYDRINTLISSVLVNTHPSFGMARPLLPNTIEIGGYHIEDPKPLPKDLYRIMNDAENGVIYFSLGSNIQSKNLHIDLRKTILNTFSNLNVTILWKFEDGLHDKPHNVIIKKWMPQTSILAHEKTKLFISHGGLLSCTEAVHFGVPMLIIPIFGDQPQNAKVVEDKGFGLQLSYSNITETSLKWAIEEMLSNPIYMENVKKLNVIYHDRPMKPRDLLGYHIEHVIRTKGARHLSSPDLSLYSRSLLDIFAIFSCISTLFIIFIIFICYKLFCVKHELEKIKKL